MNTGRRKRQADWNRTPAITGGSRSMKKSSHEPDLMTTTPKLIQKSLLSKFPTTQEAAFAYIQSVKNITICTSPPSRFLPEHGPGAVPAWFYTRVFWTGREGLDAKAMLYEIVVSSTLNIGRSGWEIISIKDFAENVVRNFVWAVQKVVESIWMEPLIQCDQEYSSSYGQITDQEIEKKEQDIFTIFTALVYHIYALVHESLSFVCSTLEQSVLASLSASKQRCPLSSQVFSLPTNSRPVVGEDGISTLLQRLEREIHIYFGVDFATSKLVVNPVTQRRLYGISREAITEMDNTNSANPSSGEKKLPVEEYVFLQIVIGRLCPLEEREDLSYTTLDDNVASKKILILYQPCTNLCVIANTGRRPPSKLLDYTPRLLAAFTATVCGDVPGRFYHTGGSKEKAVAVTAGLIESMRFQDMSGSFPLSLLQSALHLQHGLAVGRFRCYAMKQSESMEDPLMEIERVSTSLVIGQLCEDKLKMEKKRQSLYSKYGIVDHSASHKARHFQSQQQELGNKGDCPVRTRISWKWTGVTDAASKCCDLEKSSDSTHKMQNFSCGITLEGHNVFQGLQSLVASGLARQPLPDFIRDSPAIGSSVIRVENGKLASVQKSRTT